MNQTNDDSGPSNEKMLKISYYNGIWKTRISKRVARLENTICLMIILIAALLSLVIFSFLHRETPTCTPSKPDPQEVLSLTHDYEHTASNIHKAIRLAEQKIEEMKQTFEQLEERGYSGKKLLDKNNENEVEKRKSIFIDEKPSYTRSTNVLHKDKTSKTKHISKLLSRNLRYQSSLPCNGTSFHLELELDGQAKEISWELIENHTGYTLSSKSYEEKDNNLYDDYLDCLPPGRYIFSLAESSGDGLDCEYGSVCYNIYIDNELAAPQGPSFGRSSHYLIDTNSSYCAIGSSFLLTVLSDHIDSGTTWVLKDSLSNNVIDLNTSFIETDDGSKSYVSCLASGIYSLSVSDEDDDIVHCSNGEECYQVFINDIPMFEADDFDSFSILSFRISRNGIVSKRKCHQHPIISSMNEMNNFQFDMRSAQIIDTIQALSIDLMYTQGSHQNTAACWILYDDDLTILPESEYLIQRYTLALFLYAIGENAEMILSMNECDYDKVSCNKDGYITKIDLSEYGIHGTIPSELSFLRNLEILNLSNNNLIGSFPSELGTLDRLQEIHLSRNDLTGSMPSEIGKLELLRKLEFDANHLGGSIPSEIGNCKMLELLNLEGCSLEGTLPSELFTCARLQTLNLKRNKLSGSISSHIHQLEKIEDLWFGNNQLIGTIPTEIGKLTNLEWIFFGINQLTGSLPSEIGNLRNLKQIAIMKNKMNSTLKEIFGSLNSLLRFDVSDNAIFGSIPESLWHMKSIENIKISNNDLTGKVSDSVCENNIQLGVDNSEWFVDKPKVDCPCCEIVVSCYLWDPRDKSDSGTVRPVCPKNNLHGKPFFNRYWLKDDIADVEKSNWGDFEYFQLCVSPTGCYTNKYNIAPNSFITYNLGFSNTSKSLVEEDRCDAIEMCGMLFYPDDPKRIIINHLTQIVVPDLNALYDSSSPQHEALCWMLTEDSFLHDFEICDGTLLQRYILVFFYFSNEDLTFDYTKRTCDWQHVVCDDFEGKFVEHLDFSTCCLSGTLPTELGLLTRLKTIKLTNNKLSGTIDPIIFSYMPNLMEFSIGSNKIEGTMPKELFELPNIETIDVSNNTLVGKLENNVHYSESIKTLNLQDNLLWGTIAEALYSCHKLERIDISRNNFNGIISTAIGNWKNLREIQFQENRLSGSIPIAIFSLSKLEKLMLQSNMFTGSIPTLIGNLENITQISMSHNSLKGSIPTELQVLKKMNLLHLHNNKLTGTAPKLKFNDLDTESYITDCGEPSFSLPSQLECDSCSMCCNSLHYCQKKSKWKIPIEILAYLIAFTVPTVIIIVLYFTAKAKKYECTSYMIYEKRKKSIYNSNSVYCFIFSGDRKAHVIYVLTVLVQALSYSMFLRRAEFDNEDTDWAFTMRCSESRTECIDEKSVSSYGMCLFIVVTAFYLGTDLVESTFQLYESLISSSFLFLMSGFIRLFLTIFAMFTSFVYNMALAESDTDLIMNAVILLFISDLDEQCLNILGKIAPIWIDCLFRRIDMRMDE